MVQKRKPTRLASQAFWLLIAKTLGFVLTLPLPLLVVRALDQYTYGQYRQVFILLNTCVMLLPLSVSFSAFYYFPRERDRHRQIVFNIVLFFLFVSTLALLLLSLYPPSIQFFLGSADLIPYAPAIGLAIFVSVFSSMIESIATAWQDVGASATFIVGANLSKTVLMFAAVLIAPSLQALIVAAIVQGVLQSAVLLWYLNSRFPKFWTDFDPSFFWRQLRYALPIGVSGVLMVLQRDLHNFYVSKQFGSAAYAIYAVGCFQVPLITLLRDSISAVLLPRTSEYQQQGKVEEIIALTALAMRKIGLVYWPVTFLLLIVAHEFITLLFTERYVDSVPIFRWNVLLLPTVIPVTDPVFRAFAQYRFYIIYVRAVLLALLLAGLPYGTKTFGMEGAIGMVLAVMVVERAIISAKTIRILGIGRRHWPLFRGTFEALAGAAVAAVPTYFIRQWMTPYPALVSLIVCGSVYGLVYVGTLIGAGFVAGDEKKLVAGMMAKVKGRIPGIRSR